jgi:hypothetical protein
MSWGAQNRFEDAKTPIAAGGRSENPELDLWPIQQYAKRPLIDSPPPAANSGDSLRFFGFAFCRCDRLVGKKWPPPQFGCIHTASCRKRAGGVALRSAPAHVCALWLARLSTPHQHALLHPQMGVRGITARVRSLYYCVVYAAS